MLKTHNYFFIVFKILLVISIESMEKKIHVYHIRKWD